MTPYSHTSLYDFMKALRREDPATVQGIFSRGPGIRPPGKQSGSLGGRPFPPAPCLWCRVSVLMASAPLSCSFFSYETIIEPFPQMSTVSGKKNEIPRFFASAVSPAGAEKLQCSALYFRAGDDMMALSDHRDQKGDRLCRQSCWRRTFWRRPAG